ncbi:MAG: carboxypeptidase, partial [Chloroflexaceae bacterium]|nr:carboxypeptidase [Chloroflexaceae bacterium]
SFTGYDCISVYHDFRYHPQEVTTGTMDDYAYDTYGWFGFTIELWDAPTAAGIKKEDLIQWFRWHPPEDELTLLRWSDEQLGGEGFIDWQPFEHPQLGGVEIGGWNFKRVWQNAPPQYLQELAEQHCQFAIAHGLMSPKLAARVRLTQEGAGVYYLLLQLENQGFLPTYTSKKALERKAVRPTEVTLVLPEGAKLIAGKLSQEIQHLEGRSNKAFRSVARGSDYRCTVEWALKAESGSEIEIIVQSERAGTLRQRVTVGNQD